MTSFVNWSNTNTFQIVGPVSVGRFRTGAFPVDEEESFVELSIDSLRLSSVRRAFVWACCSVCDEDYERVRVWMCSSTHLFQAAARHVQHCDQERERAG